MGKKEQTSGSGADVVRAGSGWGNKAGWVGGWVLRRRFLVVCVDGSGGGEARCRVAMSQVGNGDGVGELGLGLCLLLLVSPLYGGCGSRWDRCEMMMGRGVGSGGRGALVWTHDGLAGMGGRRAGGHVRYLRFLFILRRGYSFLFRMGGVDDR